MKKRIAVGTILAFSLILVLTGCSSSHNPTNIKPTPNKTSNGITSTPTGLDSGLTLPTMKSSLPVISSGSAVDKYGTQYVNDAFKSAFAFVYRAQQIPEIWEPNTKKNPNYLAFAKTSLGSLGNYFTPELNQNFQAILPDLINPTVNNGKELNKNANLWAKLIILPWRNPNGTLPNPKSGDSANYVLMYPWVFQSSVGTPIATVSNLDGYGPVLNLQFNYLIQQPFGEGNKVSQVIITTKDMSFQMVRNTNKITAKDYPWLIGSWGFVNNDTLTVIPYDAKTMGAISNPPSIMFP